MQNQWRDIHIGLLYISLLIKLGDCDGNIWVASALARSSPLLYNLRSHRKAPLYDVRLHPAATYIGPPLPHRLPIGFHNQHASPYCQVAVTFVAWHLYFPVTLKLAYIFAPNTNTHKEHSTWHTQTWPPGSPVAGISKGLPPRGPSWHFMLLSLL